MIDKVIFIDDQLDVLRIFSKRLNRLLGEYAEVKGLLPLEDISQMLSKLQSMDNIVAYIIDENLKHSGDASYQGIDLIKKIRELDSKIPIYILTSDKDAVDELLSDIEFVIGKVELNNKSYKEYFRKKFLRHLSTYKDIKTEQGQRFDLLLSKSLKEPLTEEEKSEYEGLNIIRSKILLDEASISESDLAELDEQAAKLSALEDKLKGILGEQ